MAKAELDASDKKADFDNHMAKAALDASDQKAQFDHQMAKAELDAGDMKVNPSSGTLVSSLLPAVKAQIQPIFCGICPYLPLSVLFTPLIVDVVHHILRCSIFICFNV